MNCEFLINQLNYYYIAQKDSLNYISDAINPNYIGPNGNRIFHYFSEFSLELFYKLSFPEKNVFINDFIYQSIILAYKTKISIFMKYLEDLKCDKFSLNKKNQSPLIYSLIHRNYFISKEYIKSMDNLNLLTSDTLYDIFQVAMKNGDCLRDDCIEFLSYILHIIKEKNIKIFDESIIKKYKNNFISPLLLLCKDYSENIHEKIAQIFAMKNSKIILKTFDNINNNEIKKSKLECLNFINKEFYPLLNDFISLERDNNSNLLNSIFIYLMAFPPFKNISLFVEKYNININFQDESGKTPLMHLLNNQSYINLISQDIFNKAFDYFFNNDKLKIEFFFIYLRIIIFKNLWIYIKMTNFQKKYNLILKFWYI